MHRRLDNMQENKIRLKWSRKTKYMVSVFPKGKTPYEYSVEINGDPKMDAEGKVVANMGVWLENGIIYHLFVQPEWRNKGLGKRLLKDAENKLIRLNKTSLGILVSHRNSQAISYYEKRGYHMTDQRIIGYNVMRKKRIANCRLPCLVSCKTDGEACFDKRCPKADLE
jgi:ribosomal protein S18 acetylase RimI-like enzyme